MSGLLQRYFLILLLLACGLLTACSEEAWNNPHADADATEKVLYASFSERPKHFDPAKSYSANEYTFLAQIYEPPFQYHYLKRPYELIPATAAKMPDIRYLDQSGQVVTEAARAAFTEYTITIKPGIRYQPHPAFARNKSGELVYHQLTPADIEDIYTLGDFSEVGTRELIAEDYVFQIKRLADPRLHSPVAGLFAGYIDGFADFTQRIKDMKEAGEEIDLRLLPLSGVTALDKYRYRVRLKNVYPQFIYWMSMPFFSPMPWEAVAFYDQAGMEEKNISLNWYPVGTGPFMLTENNPNLRMVLQRNPNFSGETYPSEGMPGDREAGLLEDAGKSLPLIDRAIYSLEKENIPYWNKFLQGYYDTSGVASDSFDQAVQLSDGDLELTETMKEKGIGLASAISTSVFYKGFNMRDPVVGGRSERARKLRRAISIAVNYEEYISIFMNGRGLPAQGPLPPGIYGYEAGEQGVNPYVYNWVDGKPVRKPIEEAQRLLAEAGYPNGIDSATGKPLILYFDTVGGGPDTKANLQWMMKQYEKLGIKLVIRNTDYNRFQDKMLKGTAQIFQWGWNADYPDPENFFFLLYGPNNKVDKHGENAANYENPEFDRLFERMKNMSNGPERLDIIRRMTDIVRTDSPWVFGFNPKSVSLYHAWYRNVKPNLMANNTLKYKNLDPELRAESRAEWNKPVLWPVLLLGLLLLASVVPAWRHYQQREQGGAL